LPKCNLKCPWCDTEFESHVKWSEDQFLNALDNEKCKFAVITGGEPTLNKQFKRVCELLKMRGFEIAVETNGTVPFDTGLVDWITCSPKKYSKDAPQAKGEEFFIHDSIKPFVSEYKYVIEEGFRWSVLSRHNSATKRGHYVLSLSPEFGRFKESLIEIEDYIKLHPWWRVSLQTHKFAEWR